MVCKGGISQMGHWEAWFRGGLGTAGLKKLFSNRNDSVIPWLRNSFHRTGFHSLSQNTFWFCSWKLRAKFTAHICYLQVGDEISILDGATAPLTDPHFCHLLPQFKANAHSEAVKLVLSSFPFENPVLLLLLK